MRTRRDQMKTERDGTVHRKIIRWVGQNDLFSSKDRLFGPSKRLMYLKVIFFPDVPRDQKYACFLQTLGLCLVFSYFKYG